MAKKEKNRKSGKELQKEYLDAFTTMQALEARVNDRIVDLYKEHPEAFGFIVDKVDPTELRAMNMVYKLNSIIQAEKYLADKHPHKQTGFTCNCDKRDMPVYEEGGKNWCPQCGYEVI